MTKSSSVEYSRNPSRWLLRAVVASALCHVVAGCGPSESQLKAEAAKREKAEAEAAKAAEIARIEVYKSKVLTQLKDPNSAQFRNLKILDNDRGMCGEVNAKNAFGGYVGFSAFAVDGKDKVFMLKVMSLEVARGKESDIDRLVQETLRAGQRSQAEAIIYDKLVKKDFPYWGECAA